jgi:hypothetical protein
MKKQENHINPSVQQKDKKEKIDLPGYPLYPANEDIYGQYKEEKSIDPEEISKTKESSDNRKVGKSNEKDFVEDESGSDLDVPGSELDDEQEKIGSEDEENNYYSLGGDDHNDLDEDKGG